MTPLTTVLGSEAHIEAGTDCANWDPRPPTDLRAALVRMPCTIAGQIGGHDAVGIVWVHRYPLATQQAPPGALRITEGRFVHYYGGTDITIELVRPPANG